MQALIDAVGDGTVHVDDAIAYMEKANRHPGGRPARSLNKGPDKLDRAIMP
jgi:hypothetical protein